MKSLEILVLIPCHSLDDFPSEQTDQPAASLLNSFAVAFHPALLIAANEFPRWHRADDPPLPRRGQLIFVPTVSNDWLPHGWVENARQDGAIVVADLSDRQEMIAAALEAVRCEPCPAIEDPNASSPDSESADSETADSAANLQDATGPVGDVATERVDTGETVDIGEPQAEPLDEHLTQESIEALFEQDLVQDFLALGTCWLLIELLTRKMRQYGNVDESRFFQRMQSSAKATEADDRETAVTHLRACFEMLLEARERFYPVECYLLDMCLAVPDVDPEQLLPELQQPVPFSLLTTSHDLSSIRAKVPELDAALAEALQAGRVSIVGGEDRETSLPLIPLESALYHLEAGRSELRQVAGKAPVVWGRRRFGLSALLPQLLSKFGFRAALHVVLDDGIYPDAEYTKLRWRGVDGTLIDALSRIPLASDGAASYLRFPARMSESMDHDQVAGLILARWPTVSGPWFEDLRRSQKYAPCLGRFITLDRFFEQTEIPGQLSTHKPGEYFSPMLIQHVARREANPIGRYTAHALRRRTFDTATWFHAMSRALRGQSVDSAAWRALEQDLEAATPTAQTEFPETAASSLAQVLESGSAEIARLVMHGTAPGRGFLVVNSLSFSRRVVVPLPPQVAPPSLGGPVKAVDVDAADRSRSACVVEIPGSGYAWIPAGPAGASWPIPKQPLAEKGLLRNDLFEVAINERTGGIGHIRFHHQRSKRLSQQLSFRFPRERTITVGPEPEDRIKSQYADMRCLGQDVVRNGTGCGEIVTWGEIIDQATNDRLASFRQNVRVWRGLSTVEIEIELTDVKVPDGDPWNHYFTSRFAWNDSTAAITRGIYHSAHEYVGERFETSDYIEVASEDERLTIVPHGLPFHRQAGPRMVDSMLVVAGEAERRFKFTVAIDSPYPLEAAWNATTPAPVIVTEQGQPRGGANGWFFQVDSRNVQITRILEAFDPSHVVSPLEQFTHSSVPHDPGFALRLIETEGRSKSVKLRYIRTPTYARKRDFRGETITELNIVQDAVVVELTAYEVVDLELRFGKTS
ncbi:glycoside hydrolase family 38 N-terminal domain-containing protein [Schlesneria paludicola]|uniref:glycoside hydrolase family 38 N-terminal domain-containing protein n=1 Tax=Schlesneria paludicola TaxID=360056 RepID=UPI00029AB22B|nr:glycosyl hydrolase [Schlesneria paludicola]